MIPSAAWQTTMISSAAQNGSAGMRMVSAMAPNTLLMPSQPMVLSQFSSPGSDDRLAERQSRGGHLSEAELRAHRAQQRHEEGPDHISTMIARIEVQEAELQEAQRDERADEERCRHQVRREPDREDSTD